MKECDFDGGDCGDADDADDTDDIDDEDDTGFIEDKLKPGNGNKDEQIDAAVARVRQEFS